MHGDGYGYVMIVLPPSRTTVVCCSSCGVLFRSLFQHLTRLSRMFCVAIAALRGERKGGHDLAYHQRGEHVGQPNQRHIKLPIRRLVHRCHDGHHRGSTGNNSSHH